MAVASCIGLVGAQLFRGYAAGDQSGATHFSSYAKAVLGPLPPKSILLINNDQMVRPVQPVMQVIVLLFVAAMFFCDQDQVRAAVAWS